MAIIARAQQPGSDERIRELERKLDDATRRIEQLVGTVEHLRAEMSQLKGAQAKAKEPTASPVTEVTSTSTSGKREPDDPTRSFTERLIEPELGGDERNAKLTLRPEIFIQARYSALPIRNSEGAFEPNLSLTRIETRWSGRVNERLGAGLEIQFHPALDGSPEELVNDAFIEYYLNDHATVRVGQFIKPFGFDIQQSSGVRESPERAIFAGYFFPGQRDRGISLTGDLDFLKTGALKNIRYHVGAFNGNRFFTDNNRQANYLVRVRKIFTEANFALGFSAQRGKQILPVGVSGNNDENLIGFDFQYARGRVGLRGEFVRGNTPSTLLGLEPEFAPAFSPGSRSSGGHLFTTYRLNRRDNIYARYDAFNNDPVTNRNVRAFNFGYFRFISESSRLSFDYKFKNRPSFNDDAINGRLNITWGIEF
ncbi:MAG: porin [Acidobacteriota bacterium]|nr:porin [Acidobacteriota bacterium]